MPDEISLAAAARRRRLYEALLKAFPDRGVLKRLVSLELNMDLDSIVPTEGSRGDLVFNLIKWLESHNQMDQFLQGAKKENLDNLELGRSIAEYQILYNPPRIPSLWQPDSDLIDRTVEQESLVARLRVRQAKKRIVTIVGPPGVGKSQLQLAVAYAMRERFPQKILCVSLLDVLQQPTADAAKNAVANKIASRLTIPTPDPVTTIQKLHGFFCGSAHSASIG